MTDPEGVAAGPPVAPPMLSKPHAGALVLWLVTLTAFVAWFDYAALSAVFHPATDSAGHLLFAVPGYTNTVYPFTYAGVALSLLGVGFFVGRRESRPGRRILGTVVAVLVANLASVGMINVYEQVFVALMYLTPNLRTFGVAGLRLYWGSAGAIAGTVGGLLVVLAILPRSRRENVPGVGLCLGVTAVAFAAWFATGYADPAQGSPFDYLWNAISRVASQLSLVAAVSSRDFVRVAVGRVRSVGRRPFPQRLTEAPHEGPGDGA